MTFLLFLSFLHLEWELTYHLYQLLQEVIEDFATSHKLNTLCERKMHRL